MVFQHKIAPGGLGRNTHTHTQFRNHITPSFMVSLFLTGKRGLVKCYLNMFSVSNKSVNIEVESVRACLALG